MRALKMSALLCLSLVVVLAINAFVVLDDAGAVLEPEGSALQQGPCATDAHRAFDFWVGEWVVYNPAGQVVGNNTLELKLYGCTLHESWESASGPTSNGHSYSFYDANSGKWHQTWIDAGGNALYLEGGWTGEAMVLGDGTNRVTWSKMDGGGVRQHWEVTNDDGATWTTAFDGHYIKAVQE